VLDEDFGGDITISIQFQVEQFESFNARMIELSRGKIKAEIVDTNPETIMPI
jgi:putative IMPACT (imprinted ancient) family translation regulator